MSKGELVFMTLCFIVGLLLGTMCLYFNPSIQANFACIFFFISGIYLTIILKDVFNDN